MSKRCLILFIIGLHLTRAYSATTNDLGSTATRTWVRGYVTNVATVNFAITNVLSTTTNTLTVSNANNTAYLTWTNAPGFLTASATNNVILRTANFTITSGSPPAMNQILTNGSSRVIVSAGINLTSTLTDTAQVRLFTITGSSTNIFGEASFVGVASTLGGNIQGWLSPGTIYWFTNLSTGVASATLVTNTYNLITQ